MSGGTIINSIELGTYMGRFTNHKLSGMNNPIPNLTTVYLDTPLVGPTPKPLEYVPSPGRLGQPSRYPPSSTGGGPYTGGYIRSPPLPPHHTAYMVMTHSPLPQNNGNLTLTFFGGNYPIVLLNNIY